MCIFFSDMSGRIAIGIDLGTTNSCVGVVRDGQVIIIPNEQGSRITPSYVAFTEEERLIGASAKAQASFNPHNTVYEVKRLIGRKESNVELRDKINNWPYTVLFEDGNPQIKVTYQNEDKIFCPEEISACILSKMKKIAEDYVGEDISDAVITIPAYFTDSQRQATIDAGEIAGLNVLKILNEPTAAAIAYGVDKKIQEEKNVLVFDLGGGTFDVAILSMEDGDYEVLSVQGDSFLGGSDFDNCLVEHFIKEFKRKSGIDVSDDKRALSKLRDESEKLKIHLSSNIQQRVFIEQIVPGHDFSSVMRRSKFEVICSDLFEKILGPVETALKNAKLSKDDIHEVVLAGGSSRIPKIQQILQEFFVGKTLNKTINLDEAIAHGAAIQAAILSGDSSVDEMRLSEVTPLSLGIELVGDIMSTIVKKNTKIPVTLSGDYTTAIDFQRSLPIYVYEGERTTASLNSLLGKFMLDDIEIAPKCVPKFDVTFKIDENGILHASALDKKTESSNSIVITCTKGRLNKKQIDKMISDQKEMNMQDDNNSARSEASNNLELFCFNVQSATKKKKHNGNIFSKDADHIIRTCESTLEWLSNTPFVSERECREKREELEALCDQY